MKRAFFVTGPESTGTRMLMRALILSGAHETIKLWDRGNSPDFLEETAEIIAVHRSVPHGQCWPNLHKIRESIEDADYKVSPLVMTRDFNATVSSQVKRGYVATRIEAERRIRMAMGSIFDQLPDATPISYESFCLNDEFRKWLFLDYLDMPETTIQIWEGNQQYYDNS